MSNNKYTNEFKKKVVDEYVSGNESFYSLERKYNISNSSIKNWYYNFYKKGIDLATIKDNRGRKKEENIDYKERYEILKKYQAFLKAQREKK
jgi:transposase